MTQERRPPWQPAPAAPAPLKEEPPSPEQVAAVVRYLAELVVERLLAPAQERPVEARPVETGTAIPPETGAAFDLLPDVLTIPEAAQVLRVGTTLCYEMAAQGRIPTIKLGRRKVVSKRRLMQLLAEKGTL